MAQPSASAISMALATPSSSIDIVGSGFKMAAGAGFTAAAKHPTGFPPTPPNSISPTLPAQAHHDFSSSSPELINELDLQEAVEHARAQDQPVIPAVPLSREALSDLEKQQVITPSLLAKEYLPKIMLGHNEMPIRHIMACLTHDLRGFSRLDPPKARRMVVAALDSRNGGGSDGRVVFVKVAWGRWMAYVKGQKPPSRAVNTFSRNRMSPAPSEASSFAASYSGSGYPIAKSLKVPANRAMALGQSYTGSDMPSLDEGLEDMSMSDHLVENMSLDGLDDVSDSSSSSGDETDEEDWRGMGAAALRQRARPIAPGGIRRNYNLLCRTGPVYSRRHSSTARSPLPRVASSAPVDFNSRTNLSRNISNHSDAMDLDTDAQEREAARALLSLGSM